MAITKLSDSSITTGDKYISMLAGNSAYMPPSYESIATTTVGAGGASNIEFTSIPATYTHLQIRAFTIGTLQSYYYIRSNSDTGSNYAFHQLTGDGASVSVEAGTSTAVMFAGQGSASSTAGAVSVVDVLDYSNANKYKTFRTLTGYDRNGIGGVWLRSGLWMNTNAINTLTLVTNNTFAEYSSFALYGIKGA